jgi:inositol oxygenase
VQGPLESLEQWDDFVKDRYDPNRTENGFRQFTLEAPPVVREFYRLNHTHQTRAFVEGRSGNTWRATRAGWAFGKRSST